MESNQMFILMKNCTKIGLKLNKQMVGLTEKKFKHVYKLFLTFVCEFKSNFI